MALPRTHGPIHDTGMKRWLSTGFLAVSVWVGAARGEEAFSKTVLPTDYAAAGLAKLTPEERSRLDALVEAYRSGALAKARREAETGRIAAETRAVKAERAAEEAKAEVTKAKKAEKAEPGFLARAKVMLTPGTEIEYATVETRFLGEFRGWDNGTVFALENGQRWQVLGSSYVSPPEAGPKRVKVAPGVLGSFFLEFEGVRQRPKVKFIGATK